MCGLDADRTVACMTNRIAAGRTPTSTLGRLGAWAADHRRRVVILWDATLVRLLLQPVVLRLLGPRAWWMPAWLDRLLPEVRLSHEMPEAEPARRDDAAAIPAVVQAARS